MRCVAYILNVMSVKTLVSLLIAQRVVPKIEVQALVRYALMRNLKNKFMAEELKTEGWKYLSNAKFWHYFREGKSLCKKWGTFSKEGFEQGNDESPDNCKSCLKVLLKLKAKEN